MRKLLIISDFNRFSVNRLKEAAEEMGVHVAIASTRDIAVSMARGMPPSQKTSQSQTMSHKVTITVNDINILDYDRIVFKTVRKEIAQFYEQFYKLLFQVVSAERVLNGPIYQRFFYPSKSIQMAFLAAQGVPILPTFFGKLNQNTFPIVMKQTYDNNGQGIFKIETEDALHNIARLFNKELLITQQYLEKDADYRVIIVGQKILGYMKKGASHTNQFLTNVGRGGVPQSVEPERQRVLDAIARQVMTLGYEFAGIDVLFDQHNQPYVLEINDFPGYKGFAAVNPTVNVPKEVLQYLFP